MKPLDRGKLFCIGLAGGLVSGCLVRASIEGPVPADPLSLIVLFVLCGSTALAIHTSGKCIPRRRSSRAVTAWSDTAESKRRQRWYATAVVLWLAVAFAAVATWPKCLLPEQHPLSTWLLLSSLLGAVLTWADGASLRTRGNRSHHSAPRMCQAAAAIPMAIAIMSCATYLVAVQPRVGGVDFFYYICNARDMVHDHAAVSPRAYSYFPGVYAFWRTAWQLTGGVLNQLQTAHVMVVAGNALLLAYVLRTTCRNGLAAAVGAVWYLVFASRFEGFTGVTEPLSTAAWLLALIAWSGQTFRGRRGWTRSLVVGALLGVTVYTKQTAGLLCLGAIAWFVERVAVRPARAARRHETILLFIIPAVAACTLLLLILCEGRGLMPLVRGLTLTGEYPAVGSWGQNLYRQLRNDESTALAGAAGAIMWSVLYASSARQQRLDRHWLRLTTFALVAGLAALIQFRTRPYGHYAMLALPSLIIVTVTCGYRLAERLWMRSRQRLLPRWLLYSAVAFPLFYTGGNPGNLHVWHITPPALDALQLWHQQAPIAADLRALRAALAEDHTIYVIPPYRIEIYFFTDTRSVLERGYRFQIADPQELPWQDLDAIVLCDASADTHPERSEYATAIQRLLDEAVRQGFRSQLTLPTLQVLRPAAQGSTAVAAGDDADSPVLPMSAPRPRDTTAQ